MVKLEATPTSFRIIWTLLTISGLCLVYSLLVGQNVFTQSLLELSFSIAQLYGLLLIFKAGNLQFSKHFRFMQAAFAVGLIGALFRVLHWPGAKILMLGATMAIVLIYTIWVFQKPVKKPLDWAKLLWLLSTELSALGIATHWFTFKTAWISYLPFILLFFLFQQSHRAKPTHPHAT